MKRIAVVLWVLPVTAPALLLVLLARAGGSRARLHSGVVEAWGGALPWLLTHIYPPMPIAAITLGHVVLARHDADLERTRAHERIHVLQYERWGGFFPLLYLGASVVALLRGGDAYRDNRFEKEASSA